jgi:hypothetical protein
VFWQYFPNEKAMQPKGQGVVEYAGALVIAAMIVAAGIIVVPPNFAALINTIYTSMSSFLSGQLPT